MSEAQDFHKFIIGEIRVDGYQSQWMKDTLADREKRGHLPANAVYVAPMVVKKPRVLKSPKELAPQALCKECAKPLRKDNKNGYCEPHWANKRYELAHGPQPVCKDCGRKINRKNAFGLCRAHSMNLRLRSYRARRKAA